MTPLDRLGNLRRHGQVFSEGNALERAGARARGSDDLKFASESDKPPRLCRLAGFGSLGETQIEIPFGDGDGIRGSGDAARLRTEDAIDDNRAQPPLKELNGSRRSEIHRRIELNARQHFRQPVGARSVPQCREREVGEFVGGHGSDVTRREPSRAPEGNRMFFAKGRAAGPPTRSEVIVMAKYFASEAVQQGVGISSTGP
jgi:hypothetical protein